MDNYKPSSDADNADCFADCDNVKENCASLFRNPCDIRNDKPNECGGCIDGYETRDPADAGDGTVACCETGYCFEKPEDDDNNGINYVAIVVPAVVGATLLSAAAGVWMYKRRLAKQLAVLKEEAEANPNDLDVEYASINPTILGGANMADQAGKLSALNARKEALLQQQKEMQKELVRLKKQDQNAEKTNLLRQTQHANTKKQFGQTQNN